MIRAYINATTKTVTRAVLPGFATMVMKWLRDFKTRVLADSGTVEDETRTARILRVIENHNLMDDLKLAVFADGGVKTRTSGTNTFVVKTYDLTVNDNDPVQSVEVNQPYLRGNIAPTEVQTYKCVTGQTKTLTHTGVVVNGTYTVIKVLNAEDSGKTVVSFTEVTTGTLDTIAWTGRLYFYAIYAGTIDSGEQTEIRNAILSIIPEIEGVTIGVQHWATSNLEMVATPMGNPINEMQLAAATEKITNGGFDDANNWTIVGTASISDGVANIDGASNTACWVSQAISIPAGWVKVSFDYTAGTSGYTFISFTNNGNVASLPYNTATGSYVKYFKLTSAESFIAIQKDYSSNNVGIKFDNISVKQLGWADSTELYDGLIAQGYTAANALKEVAWWCHYNNDPANGATYGKLYNWYAAKLLQTDIDAYNAANPTTPWGWKVPTDAEWETLRTTVASLGWNYDGSTDLGSTSNNKQGKALASDSFWNASAAEGAVGNTDYTDKRNISGFTGLPGSSRTAAGVFNDSVLYGFWWSSTENSTTNALYRDILYSASYFYRGGITKDRGFSVRLLKS